MNYGDDEFMIDIEKKYDSEEDSTDSEEELTGMIETMYKEMVFPSLKNGLCGMIYTQVSDVEDEINGLYTYDREVCKVNKEKMRSLAQKVKDYINYEKR